MVIAHNISALNTFKSLNIAGNASNKSMEKLSSGYKINRAGDDAAGLSISEKMRSQIRGLNQASTNAEHGVSMIQTAEGALNEEHAILQRMRELAVQSATDTNAEEDRDALQGEFEQLTDEINRIGNTTEFNGMKILNGTKTITVDGGVENKLEIEFTTGTADTQEVKGEYSVTLGALGVDADGKKATIDGEEITFSNYDDDATVKNEVVAKLGTKYDVDVTSGKISLTEKNPSGQPNITAQSEAGVGVAVTHKTQSVLYKDGSNTKAAAKFVEDFEEEGYTATLDPTNKNNVIIKSTKTYAKDEEITKEMDDMKAKFAAMTVTTDEGDVTADAPANDVLGTKGEEVDNSVYFHVGANSNQVINSSFNDMRAKALGISFDHAIAGKTMDEKTINDGTKTEAEEYALNISTRDGANKAIESIDGAIKKVSEERSKFGAVQNRLEYTMNNLNTTSENMSAAESTIRDVDMAEEMMSLTKTNILQQAAQAMLTQGMQRPQQALQLLQG